MTHEFCTLFDVNYLPRGLVLYRSLERCCPSFRLWVFCMDAASEEALRRLDLPDVRIVALRDLERHDRALLGTKADRTQVEYCWTATPAVCRYVLETEPEAQEVTYLDADLMFFSDPAPLFEELGDEAVLIVPHRYAPEHLHKEPTSGRYNVEWLTFRRDPDGLAALHWWHERCIEWCYFRWEDGKLGDQKYLDEFPVLFDRVHALRHPGGGLAPWNVANHELREAGGGVLVDGELLVFYHFHSLRLFEPTRFARVASSIGYVRPGVPPSDLYWRTDYSVAPDERRLVWEPYLRELGTVLAVLEQTAAARPGVGVLPVRRTAVQGGRAAARRAKVLALAIGRAVHPSRWGPGRLARYRDSWRSPDVARQMVELSDEQLHRSEESAPFRSFRSLLDALVADERLPRRARLLDIGCGAGAYGELLERWAPGRFEYVGADFADEIVEAARKRWPSRTFEQRDVYAPGALDGFDVVLASGLVDVLPDYERALQALLACDAPWLLLHRQRIVGGRSRVEVSSGYDGQRTYRSYVTRGEIERVAALHGRDVGVTVPIDADISSFLLVREGRRG